MTLGGAIKSKTKAPDLFRCGVFAFLLLSIGLFSVPTRADEFRTSAISIQQPDWRAAAEQLKAEVTTQPLAQDQFTFGMPSTLRRFAPQRGAPALAQLNAITASVFPGIAQSPIPVLLPFDSAMYLADRKAGVPQTSAITRYQAGFQPASLFVAGPAGYDALFVLPSDVGDGMPRRIFIRPVEVQITGSILLYDINDFLAGKGEPVKALSPQFPDLRRTIREGYVRYTFTRFGIPYAVSIQCLDSVPRPTRLACREASAVAERFLSALRVTGGMPVRTRVNILSMVSERPADYSPDFTYRPSGEIITNSGYRNQSGHADFTVYAQIRFPIEKAPAFANSQSFMNWGDCNQTGRISWAAIKGDPYHCKRNDKPLVFDEAAKENYSYPWQDNFCETRDFEVGQCANGKGHQGQDIRPSSCLLRDQGSDRCKPDIFATVAVRDGVLIRTPSQQSLLLQVNTHNEHIRFRYIHMNPDQLDTDGMVHGRRMSEGQKIGVVSNYQDHAGGTTSHLHFDVQVFTRDGWLWVNPYVTLISAYERLIGGRGREYISPSSATPAMANATPAR